MNKNLTIALADDHVLLRKRLADQIDELGYTVLFQANDGEELLEKLSTHDEPDVVLLDINMPNKDGYETALWLKRNRPNIKIIALGMYDDESAIIRMLKNGARGYISKDANPSEWKTAIDSISSKGYHYSEIVTDKLIHTIKTMEEDEGEHKNTMGLDDREITFLKLAASKSTFKQIAAQMKVSERTLDGYREELCKKLNLKSRGDLVFFAIKHGIVTVQ